MLAITLPSITLPAQCGPVDQVWTCQFEFEASLIAFDETA